MSLYDDITDALENNRPVAKTNQSAAITNCKTCGGDRFVVVRLRSPETTAWMTERGIKPSKDGFHEEMAPCPDCRPGEITYHTVNGPFRSMDSAATRQALTQ